MAEEQTKVPQPDQDTIRYEQFTGLRNDRPIERFEHTDLAAGTNIDIDNSGAISRRAGYAQVLAGAAHSLWSDNTQCFLVSGGQLQSISAAYAATPLKTLVTANAPLSYAKINNRVYFSGAADTGIVEGGAARTWGLVVPGLPGVTATTGNLSAGVYQFSMTYSRADGQESGAPLAGQITLGTSATAGIAAGSDQGYGLSFTLPVSADPGVVLKTLYLSPPNGDKLYWALSAPNSQTTAIYTGDALELSTPLLTQFLGPPPPGQLIGYYRGRMFVAVGDTLYPSKPLAYELFDLREYIQLDGRITMFAAMEDKERQGDTEGMNSGLFIGTDRSCGVLIGKDAEGFQYVPKVDYGAIERAQTYVDGSLYGDDSVGARLLPMWLTTQGICVGMPQMEIRNLTRTKFSFPAAGVGAALFVAGPNRVVFTANF